MLLKSGETYLSGLQMFQAVSEVIGALFGGTKTTPVDTAATDTAPAMTKEQAVANFNAVFKGKGMVTPNG